MFEPRPFGKYFLTDLIAVGGMAEIYKAKTFGVDGFEKVLAIKKILSHYSADKDFITMLTNEAKLVVNLSHANIVQVYDLGRVGDDYFISMEHIDGINLKELLQKSKDIGEKLPHEIATYILSEVCKGLDYAHNKKNANGEPLKIVHRDISPQNILVSFDGGVKIVDFGIAKAAMNLSHTHNGILKGKVTYMSPEQAFGKPIDHRTDLFSLGIVFYELLTGKRLFTGESQMEVLKKIRNTKLTSDTLDPDIPEVFKHALVKALAYGVKDRYQHAADMQIDLTRLLYSHFADFSPKKLTQMLQRWFFSNVNKEKKETGKEGAEDKNKKETILVTSHNEKKTIDDHEESEGEDLFKETVSPGDDLHQSVFTDGGEVEVTEKSENRPPPKLAPKNNGSRTKITALTLLLIIVFIVSAGYLVYRQYMAKPHAPDEQSETEKAAADEEDAGTDTDAATDPLPPEWLTVRVVSSPAGARVFVDDQDTGLLTPAEIQDLQQGQAYRLKLVRDGYVSHDISVTAAAGMHREITAELKKLPPPVFGVVVTSVPAGAGIFIDGEDTHKLTPARINDLLVNKKYTVVLKHDRYLDDTHDILSDRPEDQELGVTLVPVPTAQIKITAYPKDTRVTINDDAEEHTVPFTLSDLGFPQTVVIKFKKEGYKSYEKTIALTRAESLLVDVTLEKIPAAQRVPVSITTSLVGADVFINGIGRGRTPLIVDLDAGKHTIEVRKKRYQTESRVMAIKPGQGPEELFIPLTKKDDAAAQKQTEPVVPAIPQTEKTKPSDVKTSDSNVMTLASLRVDSTPRGASVRINGSARGVTPIVVSQLPKNTALSVSVSKGGYKTWSRTVTLVRDKTELTAVLNQ
ncbi:MAG: serine/threonine protein kinase [Deltaproteobacteria bacterium]|nr:serine/threonine protein kinase [Deltaproteobacteria bacterium]